MRSFDEVVFRSIMETIDGVRDDINLASEPAKNAITVEIFESVMSACSDFLISFRADGEEDVLMLGD